MDHSPDESAPEIADASSLFGEGERPQSRSASKPGGGSASSPPSGGYDLEDQAETVAPTLRPLGFPAEPSERPRRSEPGSERASRVERSEDEGAVSPGWTRGAEWGPDLLRLAIGAVVLVWLIYATFSVNAFVLWLGVLAVSSLILVGLAYPMLITLERPVRVTPEQALADYLGALNHLRPHYRRMWLLLSDRGQGEFGSLDGLREYWAAKLAGWKSKAGKGGLGNPIRLGVETFKSDGKSAGLSRTDGDWSVVVTVGDGGAKVDSGHGNVGLVRGPDRMWYLDSGKLF